LPSLLFGLVPSFWAVCIAPPTFRVYLHATIIGSYLRITWFKREELRWSMPSLGCRTLSRLVVAICRGASHGSRGLYMVGVLTHLNFSLAFPPSRYEIKVRYTEPKVLESLGVFIEWKRIVLRRASLAIADLLDLLEKSYAHRQEKIPRRGEPCKEKGRITGFRAPKEIHL